MLFTFRMIANSRPRLESIDRTFSAEHFYTIEYNCLTAQLCKVLDVRANSIDIYWLWLFPENRESTNVVNKMQSREVVIRVVHETQRHSGRNR